MTQQTFPCPRCGNILTLGTLVCPNCGALVYAERLNELAGAAMQAETQDRNAASALWQEVLTLLPPESQQADMVRQRLALLGTPGAALPPLGPPPRPVPVQDSLSTAIFKTGGSMILSIAIYSANWGWKFATGFVLLMLIHEMGHVIAMLRYGLKASPPIFIPFVGALINLRESPRNALEEAVVGIAGPVAGTVGAIACYALFLNTGNKLLLELSYFGFFLNLFNLLPVPPLDGGRVTAAISPFFWMPGLLVVVAWIVFTFVIEHRLNYMLLLLLFFAWPRVKQTLLGQGRHGEYYQISRAASWGMGAAYVILGVILLTLFVQAGMQMSV